MTVIFLDNHAEKVSRKKGKEAKAALNVLPVDRRSQFLLAAAERNCNSSF